MITAKRLAELMTPEKLRIFAAFFDDWRRTWLDPSRASKQDTVPTACLDALEEAAAVLREVAGREAPTDLQRHRDIQLILLGDAARTLLMEHGRGEDDYVVKALHDNTARLDEASIGSICADDVAAEQRKG